MRWTEEEDLNDLDESYELDDFHEEYDSISPSDSFYRPISDY